VPVLSELRTTVRGFRRAPLFTATVLVILGLGIGVAVAMTTVLTTVLLQPLPVSDQDRLAVLWLRRKGSDLELPISPSELDQLRHESRAMSAIAGFAHWGVIRAALVYGDQSMLLSRATVTGNYFEVLGADPPSVGRLLRAEDSQAGAADVAVVSYRAWKRHFGGDRAIIGRQLLEPYTRASYRVVGIAAPGIDYPLGVDVWVPITPRFAPAVDIVARLRATSTAAMAQGELLSLARRLYPDFQFGGAKVTPLAQAVLGDVRPILVTLTVAAGLLLLIACVNVGNLLLLRAAGRGRELAVRRAVGAGSRQILRLLLVESATLAVGGGALGLASAAALLRLLSAFAPPRLPRIESIGLYGTPVEFAVATTVLSVLLFGTLPALLWSTRPAAQGLRIDSRSGTETRERRRFRQALLSAQVALALLLLAGAGLLIRSLDRLQQLDLGYEAEHLSILVIAAPVTKYNSGTKVLAMGELLAPRLAALAGVTGLTPILIPPFVGANVWSWGFMVEGQTETDANRNPSIPIEIVGPQYFETMGIPLHRGRGFVDADRQNAPYVVVMSEGAARSLWPGQDALGKRIRFVDDSIPGGGSTWRTVVGITGDLRFRALRDATPTLFLPWKQRAAGEFVWQGMFAMRTTTTLAALTPSIRQVLRDVDPDFLLAQASTVDELLAAPLAQPRLATVLMLGFGLAALTLCVIGIYGVTASAVRDQGREIGVRMALGATPRRVLREVLLQTMTLVAIGIGAGTVASLATSRLLSALLFEVSPTDPLTLAGVAGLLLLVAACASYVPSSRATRIDPALVLRAE